MLLESLPQLPSSTSIGRDHREKEYKLDTGLVIFNCPKLCDRERCRSMTFSWMLQFIKANQQSYFHKIQIVIPGSEMPSWINNQSMGGSIETDEYPFWHNYNNIIGFVCCFVLAPQDMPRGTFDRPCNCPIRRLTSKQRIFHNDVPITHTRNMTKSSHLWIIYLTQPPGSPRGSHRYSHEFREIQFYISRSCMKAKSCGYRWVCKQDLQEFNLMMNH